MRYLLFICNKDNGLTLKISKRNINSEHHRNKEAIFFGNGRNLPGFAQGVCASFLAMLTYNLAYPSSRSFTRRPIGYFDFKERKSDLLNRPDSVPILEWFITSTPP